MGKNKKDFAEGSSDYEANPEDIDVSETQQTGGKSRNDAEEFAFRILKRAASLQGVKIDRDVFLRTELAKHCDSRMVDKAVATSPASAGVPEDTVDVIAKSAISLETRKVSGLSFLAGLPGGVALVGTVPADLVQYFAHTLRIEQKLAYIYGWNSFLNEDDEVDDETIYQLVLFLGVVMQVGGAATSLTKFAIDIAAKGVAKTIERQALTKTAYYPVIKSVLRVLGVQLTKGTFAKGVSKVVPVVGGVLSGGMTYATFRPGAGHLMRYLKKLPQAKGGSIDQAEIDAVAAEGFANQDIDIEDTVRLFEGRELSYPVSARYSKEVYESPAKKGMSERDYIIAKLNKQKSASNGPSGARHCYQSLASASSLLWVAEAVGVEKAVVEQAFHAAVEAKNYRSACGAIRKVIPWAVIYEKAAGLMAEE